MCNDDGAITPFSNLPAQIHQLTDLAKHQITSASDDEPEIHHNQTVYVTHMTTCKCGPDAFVFDHLAHCLGTVHFAKFLLWARLPEATGI